MDDYYLHVQIHQLNDEYERLFQARQFVGEKLAQTQKALEVLKDAVKEIDQKVGVPQDILDRVNAALQPLEPRPHTPVSRCFP